MAEVEVLAKYVRRARLEDLSDKALEQLKIRVLDSIGVAIGALAATPIAAVRKLTALLQGRPLSTLIGGGMTTPDRAAFFNGALSRYLDFMDSYLAEGETCHPSDNLGAVLAAAEMRGATGADFPSRAGGQLPSPNPLERCRARAGQGFRSHNARRICGRRRCSKGAWAFAGGDCQCDCH